MDPWILIIWFYQFDHVQKFRCNIRVYTSSTGYFPKFHREIVFVFGNTICIEGEVLMNVETRNTVNQKASNTTPDAPKYHKQYNTPYLNE